MDRSIKSHVFFALIGAVIGLLAIGMFTFAGAGPGLVPFAIGAVFIGAIFGFISARVLAWAPLVFGIIMLLFFFVPALRNVMPVGLLPWLLIGGLAWLGGWLPHLRRRS